MFKDIYTSSSVLPRIFVLHSNKTCPRYTLHSTLDQLKENIRRDNLEMIKKVLKEMLNKANRRVINLEGISKPWAQCYQTEQYSF